MPVAGNNGSGSCGGICAADSNLIGISGILGGNGVARAQSGLHVGGQIILADFALGGVSGSLNDGEGLAVNSKLVAHADLVGGDVDSDACGLGGGSLTLGGNYARQLVIGVQCLASSAGNSLVNVNGSTITTNTDLPLTLS